MLNHFHVTPSDRLALEPGRAYFESLATFARQRLQGAAVDFDSAFCLCEYLDSVDAGDLAADKSLYSGCVHRLGLFLQKHFTDGQAHRLAGRSWAAHTLLQLIAELQRDPAERLQSAA